MAEKIITLKEAYTSLILENRIPEYFSFIQSPGLLRDIRFQDDAGKSSEAKIFVIQERDRFKDGTRDVPRVFEVHVRKRSAVQSIL